MRTRGRRQATVSPDGSLAARVLTAFAALACVASVAPASAAAVAPASAAAAARPAWRIQDSPDATTPGGQLESVSCSSAGACTAVGANTAANGQTVTLAERWNGTSWQRQRTPQPGRTVPGSIPGLSGVSCPAPNFCEAVGTDQVNLETGIGLAYGWDGSAWKQQPFPGPPGSISTILGQVSCTSGSFCEGAGFFRDSSGGQEAFAARWNGSSWRPQRVPVPPGGSEAQLTGVSCVSATFCVAVGSAFGAGSFAERWNGTSWRAQSLPGNVGPGSVSCASATFCEVAGEGQSADMWNGSSWSAQAIPSPAGSTSASLAGVSCVTAVFCAAVGQYTGSSGEIFSLGATWNGTAWALQATAGPAAASSASLSQVSCAAVTACEAVGNFRLGSNGGPVALAESWNASSWQLQHPAAPRGATTNNLTAVSCASAVFCEAVGSHFDASANSVALAEMWNGTSWRLQRTPDPARAAGGVRMNLTGVSCESAAFCEAVGSSSAGTGGGAEIWNGTTWGLQAVPGGGLTSVSCVSATFCMAAGTDGHVDTWNGTSWSARPTAPGLTSLSGVSCASSTSCEASGAGKDFTAAAEGWNGTSWSRQAVPVPANGNSATLAAVSCSGAGSCEAVGEYTSSTTFEQLPLAETWNGTAWAVQAVQVPAAAVSSSLAGVWCAAADSCTTAGQYLSTSGPTATVAETWNGTAWRLQATPNHLYAGQSIFNGVSCGASTNCTAVGVTTNPGQTPASLIETGD